MHLTRLALTDFRSYASADLVLTPGVTILSGPNGEGKTNLAEAIGYVATLGSHRVATDAPLVRQGADRAIIRAAVSSGRGNALIEIELNPGRANRVRLNRGPLPRPREILGVLRTVLFAPEDLALVKGDPAERRRFLDELLVATAPRYAAVRTDYERVVRQRTALLKSAGARHAKGPVRHVFPARGAATVRVRDAVPAVPPHCLRPWTRPSMPGTISSPVRAPSCSPRGLLSSGPCARTSRRPTRPSPGIAGPAGITYRPSFTLPGRDGAPGEPGAADAGTDEKDQKEGDIEAAMRDALRQARPGELERGVCLVGPHRDELELRVGELPARGYASHGESWSLALALRLAAYELLRADGDDPVLILDDVFAELDAGRRDRLAGLAAGAEQVIVTAAVPADVPASLAGARYDVRGGVIARAR